MGLGAVFRKIKKYLSELGRLTPIAAITTFLPIAGSTTLIIFAYPIGHWMRENWEIGSLVFLAGILVFCGLSLIPTNVIGVVSGWSFSFGLGLTVLMAGVVGSALISYAIHRRIVRDKLPEVADHHPKAKAIYEALLQENLFRTTMIIILLRTSVIVPFALTNFLMASARVPLKAYITGTFLGMLPRSSAVVFVGAGLSELTLDGPADPWALGLGIAATVATVVMIASISKKALDHLTKSNTAALGETS